MKFACFLHVEFERPALIKNVLADRGYSVDEFSVFNGSFPSDIGSYDGLVVMGGPMSIYNEKEFPWLVQEKKLVATAVEKGLKVIGICLGAQLLSHVLGGRIEKNPQKEIGWFPISLKGENRSLTVFHWHGETFSLPTGAELIASSEACENQGFFLNNQVLALQFHLEMEQVNVASIVEHCKDELTEGPYIQDEKALLQGASLYGEENRAQLKIWIEKLLDG